MAMSSTYHGFGGLDGIKEDVVIARFGNEVNAAGSILGVLVVNRNLVGTMERCVVWQESVR